MRAFVMGAAGRLGRHLAAQLLEGGHEVDALIHRQALPVRYTRLTVHRGDVRDPASVATAMPKVDVVFSALGSLGAPVPDVASSGMQSVIPAMHARGVTRIISVTGSGAYDEGEELAPHPFLRARHEAVRARIPALVADGEAHLRILRRSALDWTVVRAPFMTDEPTRAYALASEPPPPSTGVSYEAVAAAMIALAFTGGWLRQAPFVMPPE